MLNCFPVAELRVIVESVALFTNPRKLNVMTFVALGLVMVQSGQSDDVISLVTIAPPSFMAHWVAVPSQAAVPLRRPIYHGEPGFTVIDMEEAPPPPPECLIASDLAN